MWLCADFTVGYYWTQWLRHCFCYSIYYCFSCSQGFYRRKGYLYCSYHDRNFLFPPLPSGHPTSSFVLSLFVPSNSSMLSLQTCIHYSFHFIAPGLLAWLLFPERWEIAWVLMLATMLVDLDHLLAKPIFDPSRCSIGFHVLHTYPAIIVYFLLLFVPNFYIQAIAAGLLFHMYTDWQDCLWTARSKKYKSGLRA